MKVWELVAEHCFAGAECVTSCADHEGREVMGRRELFQAVAASLAVFALLSTMQKLAHTPQPHIKDNPDAVIYPTLVQDKHPTPSPTAAPLASIEPVSSSPSTDHPHMVAPAPAPAPNTSGQPEAPLTEAYCKQKYSVRRFIDPPSATNPPVLWTFPGSGNTWARLLIEFATGYYTGSVYNDRSLRTVLRGEMTCSHANVMIKAHPHTHPFAAIDKSPIRPKCRNVTAFDKAVFLVRDPYDACWSEFQRRATRSHTGKLTQNTFRWERWEAAANGLAYDFQMMWDISYVPYMMKYPQGYLLVRYEDLRSPDKQLDMLATILRFIGRPQSVERMRCALMLANHPSVNRQQRQQQGAVVTKDDAYPPELVCKMWDTFSVAALAMGYSVRNATDCSKFSFHADVLANISQPVRQRQRRRRRLGHIRHRISA